MVGRLIKPKFDVLITARGLTAPQYELRCAQLTILLPPDEFEQNIRGKQTPSFKPIRMKANHNQIAYRTTVMKLQPLAITLLLLGGIACLSSVYTKLDVPNVVAATMSPEPVNAQLTRWQYNLVRVPIFFEPATAVLDSTVLGSVEDKNAVAQFQQLGAEGWELVTIANGVAVFKRPQ